MGNNDSGDIRRFTPDDATKLLGRLTRLIFVAVISQQSITDDQRQDALVTVQLLKDHANGKLDLNEWADHAGISIVYRTIRVFDPQAVARAESIVATVEAVYGDDDEAIMREIRSMEQQQG